MNKHEVIKYLATTIVLSLHSLPFTRSVRLSVCLPFAFVKVNGGHEEVNTNMSESREEKLNQNVPMFTYCMWRGRHWTWPKQRTGICGGCCHTLRALSFIKYYNFHKFFHFIA